MVNVKVEHGWLEGEKLELCTGNGKYFSFKGIPYAEPPVGKLRFKEPQPLKPWEGVKKATKHGPEAPQKDIFTKQYKPGSEDCLYLNVYTQEMTPDTALPVMVFIHGGGYKSGSGNDDHYGPDFLVQHGVVLVTINYRLEVLGFLCLDTPEVPGNAGMKDQVAALRWVQQNIHNFGGDPNNVTIFGESAGGASCGFHILSPMSKGLFKRAVPMSGVPFCDWSVSFEPKRRAVALAKQLGLTETEDPVKLLDFLQSVPAEKLVDVNPCILSFEELNNNLVKMYHFVPVVEKDFGQEQFLFLDPEESLKKGKVNNVDVLIGYTSKECLIAVPSFGEDMQRTYNQYTDLVVPTKILRHCNQKKIIEISDKIHSKYFGRKLISNETIKEFIDFLSEVCFTYDVHKFLNLLSAANTSKKYFYKFACESERNIYGQFGAPFGIKGASHLDDTVYLFDPKYAKLSIDMNSDAFKMIQLTCTLFTNFAKFGTPTPDSSLGDIWPEYDTSTKFYGEIAETVKVGRNMEADVVQFWSGIYESAGL